MLSARFDTPGRLRDAGASSPFYDRWHARVRKFLEHPHLFDPTDRNHVVVGERLIAWTGFPRGRLVLDTQQRDTRRFAFIGSDDRDTQKEYLEWHTERGRNGTIQRVTFSTESPEYFKELAAFDPALVLRLYQRLVRAEVRHSDLFDGRGEYQPRNRWNLTDGIVHYAHEINTLNAACIVVSEAAGSGFVARASPDNYALRMSPGAPHAADPKVALDTVGVGRLGLRVALGDPFGIYIVGWDDTGWTKPNGSPVGNYWRVTRGYAGAVLRLEYSVPAGEGFSVGDIRIGGRRIEHGGQLAEHVTVGVRAVAVRVGR